MCFQKWRKKFDKFSQAKNSDLTLESEIVELNQKKNSEQMQRENSILLWKKMNSTISKTLYTCSTESLFLRYKKISKKAVKRGGFLQCSVHTFLGHDGCFWKVHLTILWKHIMKNFQVKHGQCESIVFPKTFSFKSEL